MFRICISRSPSINGTPRVIFLAVLISFLALAGCGDVGMTDVEYVERAKDHQDKGDLTASVIELKNALRQNSNNIEARWLLGIIHLEMGNGPAAEKELRWAAEHDVAQQAVIVPLAESLLLQGKQKQLLDEMIDIGGLPSDVMAKLYFVRGKAYVALGELDNARIEFQNALEVQPDSVAAWLGQGQLAFINQQWDEAKEWVLKALDISPTSDEAFSLKGDIALSQRDFSAAEKAFQSAVDVRPGIPQYRVALAIAQINAEKFDKAIRHLDLLLKMNPKHMPSNYFRAVAAYQKQDFETAEFFAEQAISIESNFLLSHLIAGAASYQLGGLEKAISHFKIIVAAAPSYMPVRKLLAAAQLKLGLVKDAASTMQDAGVQSETDAKLLEAIGTAAIQSGDLRLGRDFLNMLVHQQPDQGSARARLGFAQVMLGEWTSGIGELEKAIKMDQELSELKFILALNHIREGEYDKALEAAQSLQEDYPENPDGFTIAGIAYAAKGKEQKAKEAFAKALLIKPGDPNASNNLAAFAIQEDDLDEARRLYTHVLKYSPGYLPTLLKLAHLDALSGDFQQAIVRLEEATDNNPNALEPRVLLGRAYLSEGKWKKAIAITEPGLEKYPNHSALLEIIGRAQLETGQLARAVTSFQTVIKARPNEVSTHYLLAKSYISQGKTAQAAQELEVALTLDSTHAPSRFAQASLLARGGQLATAKVLLQELGSLYPNDPSVMELDGQIALAQKQPLVAIEHFQAALKQRETNFLTLQLAAAQFQAGDGDAGHATLRGWLEKHPEDILTRSTLADSLLRLNRLEEAREQYGEIVRQMPNNALARNNLAWVLVTLGQVDEALLHAEQARQLAPGTAQIMDTLGLIWMQKNQFDKAVVLFRNAVEQLPNDLGVRFHLAQALAHSGVEVEAEALLQELLADDQPFKEREEAQSLLNKLERQR